MLSPKPIYASVSCNLDNQLLQATLPLFQEEKIEAIEWSFDALYKTPNIPDWFVELLETYGKAGRLTGHGVFFSIFSGRWNAEQQRWLDHLKKVAAHFQFDHITEHFGFMTGSDFHKGAPISVPFTANTVALGVDRLKRIHDACQCPVGLENLAFSYSSDEVKKHGEFLNALIEPVNGFIILDLHNLYCQLKNFEQDFETLIHAYPLQRVREIHISGGSWEDSAVKPVRTIRRDTHDDAVPEEVFNLLEKALPLCPQLKFVVLEQMGTALQTIKSQEQFRADFERMQTLVHQFNATKKATAGNSFMPLQKYELPTRPFEDEWLHLQQNELSEILESTAGCDDAFQKLQQSSLKNTAWDIENWSPHMLETALRIAQKWKKGW